MVAKADGRRSSSDDRQNRADGRVNFPTISTTFRPFQLTPLLS